MWRPRASERRPGRLKHALPLALLPVLACLFFWPVLTGRVLLPAGMVSQFEPWQSVGALRESPPPWNALQWDGMAQYYPWRWYGREALRQGVIPLWNPHQFCGTPFLANAQSALLYPLNLIFWLVPTAYAFGISAILHLTLGGLFTYGFLRALGTGKFGSLVAGTAFAFSGFICSWIELPTVVNSGIWLPLVLLCLEQFFSTGRLAWSLAAGGALGISLLAGHPQVAFYVWMGAAAYFLFRALSRPRRWLSLAAGAVMLGVGLLLAAGQTLPTAEVARYSHRAALPGWAGYQAYVSFSMPWQHLVTLLLPDFFGNPSQGDFWGAGNYAEFAGYLGLLPLAMAGVAVGVRRDGATRFFAAAAVVCLLLATGTLLNAVAYFLVPGFSRTGGPGRIIYLYTMAGAALAGLGADSLARHPRPWRPLALAMAGLLAGGLVLVLLIWRSSPSWLQGSLSQLSLGELMEAASTNLRVLAAIALASLAVLALAPGTRRPVKLLLLGLVAADLFVAGIGYNPTATADAPYPTTPAILFLKEKASGRIISLYRSWPLRPTRQHPYPQAAFPPNSATALGLNDALGYDSLHLIRYRELLAQVEGGDPSPPANGNMLLARQVDARRLPELGVEYLVSPWSLEGMAPVYSGEVNIYQVPGFAGIATLDGRPVKLERPSPNRIRCRLPARASGSLLVRETAYPGWHTLVDGKETPAGLANRTFRKVELVQGGRTVEFIYLPASFRVGLFLTLIGVGILSSWLIVLRK